MAITSLFKISETIDAKGKGEISTWTQVFRLETNAIHTPAELIELNNTGSGGTIPRLRTRPYSDKRWIVRQIDFSPVDVEVWQCTVTLVTRLYTDNLQQDSDVSTGNGNRIWWTMSRRAVAVTTDWYYDGTIPVDFAADWPPTGVVGGEVIDLAGVAFKQPMWRHEVFLTTFFERAYRYSVGGANYWSARAYYDLDNAINKRNEAAFLGYPVGQIALVGFDEQPSEDPWQSVTLRFVATEYGHLEQRPRTGPEGKVLLGGSPITIAGATVKTTSAAYWFQPYPELYDFNDLSDFTEITNPSPAW